MHPRQVGVGDHPDDHGVTRVNVRTERAGQHHLVHVIHAQPLHHQPRAGIERGLAELNRAHVVAGDDDRPAGAGLLRPGQHIFGFGALPAQPGRLNLRRKTTIRRQHARHEQLGHRLDDSRAADAGRQDRPVAQERLAFALPALGRGLGRRFPRGGRSVVPGRAPLVAADHLEVDLQRLGVHPDALDGAGRGAHPMPDLRTLERRAGRAGGRAEPLAVPQEQLAVRPHIHDQPDFVGRGLIGPLGQHHRDVVRADVPGLDRQHVRLRAHRQAQPQLPRLDVHGIAHRRAEGRLPQLLRRDVEQDVVHHAVAHQHDVGDRIRRGVGVGRGLDGQLVQCVDHRAVERRQAVLPVVRVADTAHQVFAVSHLRVHPAGGR